MDNKIDKLKRFKIVSNVFLTIFSIKGSLMILTGIINLFSNIFEGNLQEIIGSIIHGCSGIYMLVTSLFLLLALRDINENKNNDEKENI